MLEAYFRRRHLRRRRYFAIADRRGFLYFYIDADISLMILPPLFSATLR